MPSLCQQSCRYTPEEVGVIAIITPYTAQVRFLRSRLKKDVHNYEKVAGQLDLASVDSFQGREADIVLFSCVRAPRRDSPASNPSGAHAPGVSELELTGGC